MNNFIKTQSDLDSLCDHIANLSDKIIGIDTEFERTKSYYPIPSLLQINTGHKNVAIDMSINTLDFSQILNILKDQKILKVLHAGTQDAENIFYNHSISIPNDITNKTHFIILFQELYDKYTDEGITSPIANVFDTQIADQFLGEKEKLGYSNIMYKYKNIKISKALQFSDWLKRPLSNAHMQYCLNDVRHLIDLHDAMIKKIEDERQLSWIFEEAQSTMSPKKFITSTKLQFSKIITLAKSENRSLKESDIEAIINLLQYREGVAISHNTNRAKVMSDKAIILNAKNPSYHLKEVIEFKNDQSLIQKCYKLLNQRYRIDGTLFDELKILLHDVASKHNIAPTLIANTSELRSYACQNRTQRFLSGWRYDVFGSKVGLHKIKNCSTDT